MRIVVTTDRLCTFLGTEQPDEEDYSHLHSAHQRKDRGIQFPDRDDVVGLGCPALLTVPDVFRLRRIATRRQDRCTVFD
jgi:hypothetical protein